MFVAALAAATNTPRANAHGGDPKYESMVTAVKPAVTGLTAEVPGGGSHLRIVNRTGRTVTILGYEGESFARLSADGTVEENLNSPSYWLNEDAMGNAPVPKHASARATPDWRTVDSTGSLEWHDHRVHWMGGAPPAKIRDQSKRTLVLQWGVPIQVDGKPVSVEGDLFWRGQPGWTSSAMVPAFVALGVVGICLGMVAVRRRRSTVEDHR